MVREAGIEVRSGRKWNTTEELNIAEERLRQIILVGTVAKGRTGLGYFPRPRIEAMRGKERRHLVQEDIQKGVEEGRITKMIGLSQQGA